MYGNTLKNIMDREGKAEKKHIFTPDICDILALKYFPDSSIMIDKKYNPVK